MTGTAVTPEIVLTQAMLKRRAFAGVDWQRTSKPGYYWGEGFGFGLLTYIALPQSHFCVNMDYNDLYKYNGGPRVNGGLTFSEHNVFGWDYSHAWNYGTPQEDAVEALKFFYRMNNPLWRQYFLIREKIADWRYLRYRLRNRIKEIKQWLAHRSVTSIWRRS